jgi:HK97 family phage portal protein
MLPRFASFMSGAIAALPPLPRLTRKSLPPPLVTLDLGATERRMALGYAAFAREGVMQNPVVYRGVRMVAEAAASVPLLVYDNGAEADDHPLAALLARPNSAQARADLIEMCLGHLLVGGNAYLEATGVSGEIRALYALRPDRIRAEVGTDGWTESYVYTSGEGPERLEGEAVPGVRRILHLRLFHPLSDTAGLSPIEAAASAINVHNAATRWNQALLDNAARPSGALVYSSGGQLTTEQFLRLKTELEQCFQGARNAGRPLLLEGGLDWKAMSLSPRDMDFLELKHAAAREIALAIGVPPMLLGIPGDNTFSNYQEANRTLWRQTVLPLLQRTTAAIAVWLGRAWGGRVAIEPDLDAVDALSGEREALWSRLDRATFLTQNEKRQALGYGPLANGDEIAAHGSER